MDEKCWVVKIDPTIEAELTELIKRKHLNQNDQITIATWINEIEENGPEFIRGTNKIWRDHELSGEWIGHRSSLFNEKGRIIYRIKNDQVIVVVVKITATHDYDRKESS